MKSFCQSSLCYKVGGYEEEIIFRFFLLVRKYFSLKVLNASLVMEIHATSVSQCLVAPALCPGNLSSRPKHKFERVLRVNVFSGLLSRCEFCVTNCVVPKLDHF